MVNCDHHDSSSSAAASALSKAICSICHKDLDPFADDLQAIFICGHVFHEFCLQESFGFFESVKRYSCPVCKQRCSPNDAVRLYFESVCVSPEEPSVTPAPPIAEDSEALRREVKELKDELNLCREQAKKEVANLKNEALKQQASIRQTLHMKTEALDKLTVECLRQQERNRALTKELAAFKLASDLDLDEKEVEDLATIGNGGNNEDTIGVLRKSLVLSNRNRKELMTQCKLLERGEARHQKKLEKAKGKINKLNTKIQELTGHLLRRDEAHHSRKLEKAKGKINKLKTKVQELKDQRNLLEQGEARYSRRLEEAKGKINKLKAKVREIDAAVKVKKETSVLGPSNLFESTVPVSGACDDIAKAPADDIADGLILDDVKQVQSELDITKESPIIQPLARPDAAIVDERKQVQPTVNSSKESPIIQSLPRPASAYFSGGLVGPDGTKRFLGKWCKRREDNQLVTNRDSSTEAGSSLVVVSDEEDITKNIPRIKRLKYEDKSEIVQSQGCLQYNTSLEGFVTNQRFRGSRFLGSIFKCTKTQRWKYDVFLSFTGETRKGFTHFLYRALLGRGLKVFRDQELERGTNISSTLMTAIEESRFAIVVLSPKYASSTWCLDELTKIMECKEVKATTILPIFYKVKPTNVRNQRGAFANSFNKHETSYVKDRARVKRWRSAFTKLSYIAGWISTEWYEYELIEEIVEFVCST